MAEIIDAHHHLWHYTESEFGWIGEEMRALKRDFLPADLDSERATARVAGTVVVQARQTLDETRWLLECARESPSILGVVGWVPLASESLRRTLREFAGQTRLKGVRHVVQDEPDDDFILGSAFNRGVAALADTGLVYDILILERHLPQALEFARRHPSQRFVLDHLAKPKIASGELEPWRSHLMRLADRGNVSCKLSGLVTEANWATWTSEDLHPYLDTALEAFGAERLMAGSDWPVCMLASSYRRWWSTLESWAGSLPEPQRETIFSGTARSVYGL